MLKRRQILALLTAASAPAIGHSQNGPGAWPQKPIRWVLSQPAGSGPDNVARQVADQVSRRLGQPIFIDNRPGGQNVIGAQNAARSTPDGYTFYFSTAAALVSNPFLFKSLPYDPEKDFVPVAFIGRSPFGLLVRSDSPVKSFQQLVARSRAANGSFSLANEGPRTFGGIIARMVNARSGMNANLVSYMAVGSSLQDLMGGITDCSIADVASSAQLVRQGRLRLIAVVSRHRVEGFEDVPAIHELIPSFEMNAWMAVVAPAGTPTAAINRMHAEINRVLADPEIDKKILTIGPIPEPMPSPESVGVFLQEDRRRWALAAKEIGIIPE